MSEHTLRSVRAALFAAGREPIEPVEPRLAGLEARLLRAIADDDEHTAVVVPFGGSRRLTRSAVPMLAVAACLLALVVFVAGWLRSPDGEVVISSAENVSVVFPDGSVVAGIDGLELPDGSRLVVAGTLVVDGDVFGPGDYRVDGGAVVALDAAGSTSSTVANATSGVPATLGDPPVRSSAPAIAVRPPESSAPSPTTIGNPPASRPPPTRATTTPERSSNAPSRPGTTAPGATSTTTTTTTTSTTTSTTTPPVAVPPAAPRPASGGRRSG